MASANLDLVRSIARPGSATRRRRGRDFLSAWEGFRVIVDELRELDDERVLALTHAGGRGRTSGVELANAQATAGRMAHLFHIRGEKVMKLVVYFDRARALAELGLTQEARSAPS